ncbi:MAG: Ig domain-containing protein [Clostridiales bacterium]|nr:Ig domain-containing protein [Clostridiales bacterium]
MFAKLRKWNNPNKYYIAFIIIAIPTLLFFLLSNVIFTKNIIQNLSYNYKKTIVFGDYYIKVDHATYNTDTQTVEFYWYVKSKLSQPATSTPTIYSIYTDYALDTFCDFSTENIKSNQYADIVQIPKIDSSCKTITIWFATKNSDYQPPDTYDEFGNVTHYEMVEGETTYVEVVLDFSSIKQTSNKNNEFTTIPKNNFEVNENDIVTADTYLQITTTTSESTTNSVATSNISINTTAPNNKTETLTKTKTPTKTSTTATKVSSTNTAMETTAQPTTTIPKVSTAKTTTTKIVTTTLIPISLKGLSLKTVSANNEIILTVGQTSQITPIFTPVQATNKTVTWKSTNEQRVIVDLNGKVTARSSGAVIIICTSEDGNLTASCMVVVK